MRNYYQNLITDKSFTILKKLKKDFDFVLIGGWAVYFYNKALKSKDIDLIVDYNQLDKLKNNFEISKNERLKKYEIKMEEIDIDIYLPFYSHLGIPVEEITKKVIIREGFKLPKEEILLITKLYAYSKRKGSIKGEKDKIDILSLLIFNEIDYQDLSLYAKEFSLTSLKDLLKEILFETKEIKELNLNQFRWSKTKKEILKKF